MLYFKDLFNKFCLKISTSNLFKFFFGCVFLFFFIPNVSASELLFGSGTAYVSIVNGSTTYISTGDTTNNMPKTIYGLTANGDVNLGTLSLGLYNDYDMFPNGMNYSYLIFDTCLTGSINVVISNSSCNNSCVSTGTYKAVAVSGSSCTTNGITGTRYYIQVPIQKWYYNSNAETYTAASYIHVTNNVSWSVPITINNMFLSDEDFTVTYANQAALIDKLNSVQTAITNMQSGIINNNNTNTQSIINNQNSNTNAINGNIDQEFSDLKNYDHTYNNNATDTPSNQSDINNVLSQQNTLSSSIDLDSSILDVTLNTDATTWIWGVVDNLRTINGKITLLFTTILSLAVIKMILNR